MRVCAFLSLLAGVVEIELEKQQQRPQCTHGVVCVGRAYVIDVAMYVGSSTSRDERIYQYQ